MAAKTSKSTQQASKAKKSIAARGRSVLQMEADAVQALVPRIDSNFEKAVRLILDCPGRVIVTGMGKAGHIGQKISATMASTGTLSFWVHPAEAIHGDMGRITKSDVILAISKSGETEEVLRLLPIVKRIGARIISMTGNPNSTLARQGDVALDVSVKAEACTLQLAPTTSTTAMLAMGDAISVVVSEQKGFREEDFALFHPGGQLGRKLLLRVADLMRTGISNPRVAQSERVKEVLVKITKARAGCAIVVDGRDRLLGIFTDGDLRRHIDSDPDLLDKPVGKVMTAKPKTIEETRLAEEALRVLQDNRIDELVVVDAHNRPIGLLDVQDLLRAGFV